MMLVAPYECHECQEHVPARKMRHCKASCCEPDGGAWHCPTCWPLHDAQQFLESHGITELNEGGLPHHEILRLMVLYRQER